VDEDLEWIVSVSRGAGAFGGYRIERRDPASGEHDTATLTEPNSIATDAHNPLHFRNRP
jgi:hypothetical protein